MRRAAERSAEHRRSSSFGSSYDMIVDMEIEENTFLMLLGIHAAQYHDTVKAYKVKRAKAESDDTVRDGDRLRIPNSMAIVVPAWEIGPLLNLPIFLDQRLGREAIMREKAKTENTADPESVVEEPSAPPSIDANPKHLEDFTRLVDVAARKRPRGGQT